MGLNATSHTVIELDIPYAKKEIEGFSELYSIITKQLDLAFMGGQDAEEFDRLWGSFKEEISEEEAKNNL